MIYVFSRWHHTFQIFSSSQGLIQFSSTSIIFFYCTHKYCRSWHMECVFIISDTNLMNADVFSGFMNEKGELEEKLHQNVDALMSLYEAAFLAKPDEKLLESIEEFARASLSNLIIGGHLPEPILMKVQYALAAPSYRRMKRLDAKFYISLYEKEDACHDDILELAKLDFHALLLMHREEVTLITS